VIVPYSEFPKLLYNSAGEPAIANGPGDEAGLAARGYSAPSIEGAAEAFDRIKNYSTPVDYVAAPYPTWIVSADGTKEMLVADAAHERRIRAAWGEEMPEPEAETDAALLADFQAWRNEQGARAPIGGGRRQPRRVS
jgi:hypothetical protein